MSKHDDKKAATKLSNWSAEIDRQNAAQMPDKLKDLVLHFAKPVPGKLDQPAPVPYDKRLHANTTIRMFLVIDGKGKFGDVRYTRPTFDAQRNRDRYDGKSVFVARAHMKPVGDAQYGETGTFDMPLSAALTYGLIRGKEFHA